MLLFIHQICFSNCVYDKENLTPLSLVYCAMVIKRHIKVLDDMLLLKVQKKKKNKKKNKKNLLDAIHTIFTESNEWLVNCYLLKVLQSLSIDICINGEGFKVSII